MKNVLLIGSELGKGGAERSISLLSYYLEKTGYNVTLCILSGKDRTSYYKTCKEIIFVDPPEYKTVWEKIMAWKYRLSKIRKIKKERKIDISISFLEGPDYVNVLTRTGEKVALSIRGSKMFDKEIAGWGGKVRKRLLIPFLYRNANEIICVTQALADELHEYFHLSYKKLKVIYNFYETEEIHKKTQEPLNEEEQKIYSKPVIITSGRLHIAKEHVKLIQILRELKKKHDVRLIILGDGDLKYYFLKKAMDWDLKVCMWEGKYEDADVYLLGYQKNAFKFYQHSAMFALPSSWEGFPNVLAEALICRKPVVTTDCPTGPREILDVKGLGKKPTEVAIPTPVGTLLPMLDNIDDNRIEIWCKAIEHWLYTAPPPNEVFDKLTNRFTTETLLKEWTNVIENK